MGARISTDEIYIVRATGEKTNEKFVCDSVNESFKELAKRFAPKNVTGTDREKVLYLMECGLLKDFTITEVDCGYSDTIISSKTF